MTTMSLTIDDKSQDILEALKTILSNFKGVSFEIETIETIETKEDILGFLLKTIENALQRLVIMLNY